MANISLILNTSIPNSDPSIHLENLKKGIDYIAIASTSYRITVPWLCCFRGAEFSKVTIPITSYNEELLEPLVCELPYITVANARRNLETSLEIFQELILNKEDAKRYWEIACNGFENYPFKYLTLDPIEVYLMAEYQEEAIQLVDFLKSSTINFDILKKISKLPDHEPYPADEFYGSITDKIPHQGRIEASQAFDAGYYGKDFWEWHYGEKKISNIAAKKSWWKFWE